MWWAQLPGHWSAQLLYAAALCSIFFFFQAEDGIRDVAVTGVQTCALPISTTTSRVERLLQILERAGRDRATRDVVVGITAQHDDRDRPVQRPQSREELITGQIGRASCRERV